MNGSRGREHPQSNKESRSAKPSGAAPICEANRRFPEPKSGVLAALVGKLVLRFCRSDQRGCDKSKCALKPFCECAKADWEAARRLEMRVWMAIGVSGAVLVLVALIRSVAAEK